MRDAAIAAVTSLLVSKSGRIYARNEDPRSSSEFDATTGERLSGDLDLAPQEALYLAWRQKQSPSLSERALRRRWEGGTR